MAYMSQEKKAKIAPKVKEILKKYGIKGRLGVHHHSTLVMNITSGSIDFIKNYNETAQANPYRNSVQDFQPAKDNIQVNHFHYDKHFTGKALEFFKELVPVMHEGNHDNSDIQSDYFDIGWYVSINIGKWDQPYELTEE